MKIKYDAWIKDVITEALKEITEEHKPAPEKIVFEGVEYLSVHFLEEIQRRTAVGEAFLQRIYDSGKKKIEQSLESFLTENPDHSFCDVPPPHKAPTRREKYEDITKNIEENTEEGKSFLIPLFGAYIVDFFTPQKYDPLDMDVTSGKDDLEDDDIF